MKYILRGGALFLLFIACNVAYAKSGHYLVFVGTYTHDQGKDSGSKGIYAYRFDEASGKLTPLGLAAATENPSFLAAAPSGNFLYAVNELQKYQGQSSGGVTAFGLDRKTGKLTQLDEVASHGADPCYISFDKSGKYVLVANYTGGNVAVFPVSSDGKVGEASSVSEDKGELGPNKERQEHSHAHWIETSANNHSAYVADLGLDRALIYNFDATKGSLSPLVGDSGAAVAAPATGPRHIAMSRGDGFMYVLGEVDSTVTVFVRNAKGIFRSIQKISALPAGFSGQNDAAEIVMRPGGRFLYTSNRGDDSIALFAINRTSGKLTFVQRTSTGGKTPRNFAVSPSGSKLLAANEETGNIVEFKIDSATGKLTSEGEVAKVPAPVCLVFVPEE